MVKLSEAWFVAPYPLPLYIRYANQANDESRYLKFSNDLKSVLGHLNSRSVTSHIDTDDTSSSLAIAQAVQIIEECYGKPSQRRGVSDSRCSNHEPTLYCRSPYHMSLKSRLQGPYGTHVESLKLPKATNLRIS